RDVRPRDLVILCDISGSMERYSRMLLHFMHTITAGKLKVETFVFGTRLTRITRTLRRRDIDDAVTSVSQAVNDWAGGTRIGEAVRDFNYLWARRVLRSGAVVLIISDGWDRGDIPLLEREIARLARSCARLIWLNPLLGYEGYEPLTRGMRAVLPSIDDFLPVHNLESLQQIGAVLASVMKNPNTWNPSKISLA
ncbi:MAG: VWA domain-containing protein, partial [bacterium]